MLHPRVGVLARLVELHTPAVDGGADRQVERQHGRAELVEVVGLRRVEHQLQDPEAAAGELVPARQHVRARPRLHRFAERALDRLAFRPELLDDQARTGLQQREGAVGVVAERLAEAGIAVAGRARVHDRLDLKILLAGLPPEEDRVLVARDVVEDVGICVLQLEDDGREVVGGERVVFGPHLLHAEFLLGALARRLGHALAVRGVLREERDAQLARLLAEPVRQVLGDELDVVPAEPGAVDLGAEHVLQVAPREPWVDARRLPVDDVLARGGFARGAAEGGGERAADDLGAFTRGEPRGFRGGRGGIGRVPDCKDELLAHDAAEALVDEIAHELVAFEVALALGGEVAGQRLQHPDLVFPAERLLALDGAHAERQRHETDEPGHDHISTGHAVTLL